MQTHDSGIFGRSGAIQIETGKSSEGNGGRIGLLGGDSKKGMGGSVVMASGDSTSSNRRDIFEGAILKMQAGSTHSRASTGGDVEIYGGKGFNKDRLSGGKGGNVKLSAGDAEGGNEEKDVGGAIALFGGSSRRSHGGRIEIKSGTSDYLKTGNIIMHSATSEGASSGDGKKKKQTIIHFF